MDKEALLQTCPVCEGPAVRWCKCPSGNRWCEKKHQWKPCYEHQDERIVVPKSMGHAFPEYCTCPEGLKDFPATYKDDRHPHELVLTASPYGNDIFECDGCEMGCHGASYHCAKCRFDLHIHCTKAEKRRHEDGKSPSEGEKIPDNVAAILSPIDRKCTFPIGIDKKDVWDWFGEHGCFLGDDYPESMIAPATTPFKYFYFVRPTETFRFPIVAVMLKSRKERKGKISDVMEIIPWDATDELVVYVLVDPKDAPEPRDSISLHAFQAAFAGKGCEEWVAPVSLKRPLEMDKEEKESKKPRKD